MYLATRSVRLGAPVLIWPALRGHGQVGDGGVLGFAGAMGDHGGVAGPVSGLDGLQGLGEGADLVDLDEDGVGHALFDAGFQALGVGDERSSPTNWTRLPRALVSSAQPSQSFSPMPSSREMMG